MVGEAAIIGQQLRLTVLAGVPVEGGPASAVRGAAAAVEAEAAALLDRQGVAGAVGRRAAQVLGESGSAEADGDAVALERPFAVAALIPPGRACPGLYFPSGPTPAAAWCPCDDPHRMVIVTPGSCPDCAVRWAAAVRGDDGRHVTPLRAEEDVSGALLASLCGCGPQIGPGFSKGGDRWSLFTAAALCAPGNREIRAEVSVRLAVRADLAVSATPRGGAA
jgi:hypothetical protein